ncbi:MAG: DNA adenine methylase [Acidobacteriota bacterium]|nr:DNA adenine methylase [Acidobacteriota bacterium]
MNNPNIQTIKNKFLATLSVQKGKNKYKRYLGSPLRYAGGKSLATGLIIELLPNTTKRLISPFMGGGAVEIACAKELQIPVISFDIFDILTNYWNIQINHPRALHNRLSKFKPDKETFARVKQVLKDHWDNNKRLAKYDLAAHYYFNSNTSYGPHFLGWPSSVYLQKIRYEKTLEKVKNFHAPLLQVGCQSFEYTIQQYNKDFLYCDPPYYLGEDSKMFVGMYPHRNFPIHHKGFKHELLRDLLLKHKAGFILSYNDCPTIRKWYKECNMTTPKWQYTFGQGDTRIGKNRIESNGGSHIKKSHELLIWRFPK